MKASLSLEAIGHDQVQRARLWERQGQEMRLPLSAALGSPSDWQRWGVWELTPNGERQVYGRTDYSRANSKGSRGVRVWYALESGRRYRVKAPRSWGRVDEYRCRVTEEGDIVRTE